MRVAYFKSKAFDSEAIARIIAKAPPMLSYTVKQIDTQLGYLQKEFKLTGIWLRAFQVYRAQSCKFRAYFRPLFKTGSESAMIPHKYAYKMAGFKILNVQSTLGLAENIAPDWGSRKWCHCWRIPPCWVQDGSFYTLTLAECYWGMGKMWPISSGQFWAWPMISWTPIGCNTFY